MTYLCLRNINKESDMKSIATKADKAKGKREKSLISTHKRAISDNAYTDFTLRLEMTLSVGCRDDKAYREAVELLDRYIMGDNEAFDRKNSREIVWIALAILRPEIDKAMRRSRMARERAIRRHEQRSATNQSDLSAKSDTPDNFEFSGPKLNRRERRLLKQNLAREARKSLRKQLLTEKRLDFDR